MSYPFSRAFAVLFGLLNRLEKLNGRFFILGRQAKKPGRYILSISLQGAGGCGSKRHMGHMVIAVVPTRSSPA